jgi:hypothetical protein
MNIQVAVLCDAATDSQGKLNLLGAFDTIFTPVLPAEHPQCSVALRATFAPDEEGAHQLKLSLLDDDGRGMMPPIEIPVTIALPDDSHFVSRNFIINIQQLRFDRPGCFLVDVALDGRSQTSIPLQVKLSAPQTPAGDAP